MNFLKIAQTARAIKKNPGYVFMRAVARFYFVRVVVRKLRQYSQYLKWVKYKKQLKEQLHESMFTSVERDIFFSALKKDGVAFGLKLPDVIQKNIVEYAKKSPCYADRDPEKGFFLEEKEIAEKKIDKKILIAQYFNSEHACSEIKKLSSDPFLLLIAAEYLQSIPTPFGVSLWWTFPVMATVEDRLRHAHFFHRDVDDYAFLKFFFYLTDINFGDGAHVCVPGSQRRPLVASFKDNFFIRRWGDEEVLNYYGDEKILTINGVAGTGFAEDTSCIHKGNTPFLNPRLLLQLQFGLFDHGEQHDNLDQNALKMIS